MAWKIELSAPAARELDNLDPPQRKRILKFLHERLAALENPRSIGQALHGSELGEFGNTVSETIGSFARSKSSGC